VVSVPKQPELAAQQSSAGYVPIRGDSGAVAAAPTEGQTWIVASMVNRRSGEVHDLLPVTEAAVECRPAGLHGAQLGADAVLLAGAW
jgi:hypothetical protein